MASSLTPPATDTSSNSSSSPSYTTSSSSSMAGSNSLSTSGSESSLRPSSHTDVSFKSSATDPVSEYQRQIYLHTKKQMEAAAKMSRRRSKKFSSSAPDAHATLRSGGSSEEGSDA